MAALLTSVIDNPGKVSEYILVARSMGIEILPPDINEGEAGFSVSGKGIRYALTAINTSNVNDLMFTAYSKFPSLHRKAQRLALKELELWRKAIYADQRAGIVRRDIDREQIAMMFTF